jgi:diguanylate cyclase (GGDEF)-like protein/PAS domain S-box-containing protein
MTIEIMGLYVCGLISVCIFFFKYFSSGAGGALSEDIKVADMIPESADKLRDNQSTVSVLNTETELGRLKKKYEDLCSQMDEILMETMERSNRIVMDAEISNLIMNQVFNASNDAIWAIDKSYKVIRVNKMLLSLIGKPANEVIGAKCYELLPESCEGPDRCPMKQMLKGTPIVEQEKALIDEHGASIPFQVTYTPLSSLDMSTIGMVETWENIAERKHAEEILQLAHHELERLATEDGLTKLANRRHFDEYLEREWLRQIRNKKPISLMLCDVDFFKYYNDLYGHQAGDLCLKAVAESLQKKVERPGDLNARYGGEEFVVVMPETDSAGAWHVAENIRQEIVSRQIPHSRSTAAPFVTISCGLATILPATDIEPKVLIEMADQALYRAKQNGRNRTVIYDAEIFKPSVFCVSEESDGSV